MENISCIITANLNIWCLDHNITPLSSQLVLSLMECQPSDIITSLIPQLVLSCNVRSGWFVLLLFIRGLGSQTAFPFHFALYSSFVLVINLYFFVFVFYLHCFHGHISLSVNFSIIRLFSEVNSLLAFLPYFSTQSSTSYRDGFLKKNKWNLKFVKHLELW